MVSVIDILCLNIGALGLTDRHTLYFKTIFNFAHGPLNLNSKCIRYWRTKNNMFSFITWRDNFINEKSKV